MDLPLHIRYLADGQHRAAGILIPGGDPTVWLAALTCWGIGTAGLRFLLISQDHRLSAESAVEPSQGLQITSRYSVLVIGEEIPDRREAIIGSALQSAHQCDMLPLFYQRVADRLYLPVDAELIPHVTDAELRLLLPGDSSHLLVWHPSAGLIEFEPDQTLTAVDLLRGPDVSDARWDGAKSGKELNDRIRSLNAEVRDNLIDIVGKGRGDIGQSPDRIDDAPRSPDEVRNPGLHDAVRGLRRWIGGQISSVAGRPSSAASGTGTPGRIKKWVKGILNGLASAISGENLTSQRKSERFSSRRENELKRLLNLLDKNPDLGLRYALPFGNNSSRGTAKPSDNLGERNPDFDIRQLRSSGPADSWAVPWEYQSRLIERYRDLAQREMRLGNHRRAAYIYAVLLNDLHAAATALEVGGLYFDAATIYEKHLRNRVKAAECLRKGGFWEEALIHFRTLERWIDAGELMLKLNRPDEARLMFRNEIDCCKSRREFLRAGELADQRLDDPERSAELFAQGWKLNAQPDHCFRAMMELYGRRGLHSEAQRALQNLSGNPSVDVSRRAGAVKVCSEAATVYPDEGVREIARRQTWHLASVVLSDRSAEQNMAVLAAVRSLSKSDELLQRDVQRFAVEGKNRHRSESREDRARLRRANAERKSIVPSIRHLGTVQLQPRQMPEGIRWQSGCWTHGHCYLLSTRDKSVLVAGFRLPNRFRSEPLDGQSVRLTPERGVSFEGCQLRANTITPNRVFLQQFPGTRAWNETTLSRLNDFDGGAHFFVDVLKPYDDQILDFIQLPTGTIWVLTISDQMRFVLLAIGANGLVCQELAFVPKDFRFAEFDPQKYRLCNDGVRLFVLAGNRVYRIRAFDQGVVDQSARVITEATTLVEFPETPLHMTGSPTDTERRLAFSFRNGAQVVWPFTHQSCAFAQDLAEPLFTWTSHGLFVAACRSTGRLECYRLASGRAERVAELEHPIGEDRLLNLFPSQSPNEFHLLQESGRLEKFQIPVR